MNQFLTGSRMRREAWVGYIYASIGPPQGGVKSGTRKPHRG